MQIRGLIRFRDAVQVRLDDPATPAELLSEIDALCLHVESLCEASGADPADLPAPSRRAYQWLKGLTEDEALSEHIALRRRIRSIFESPAFRRALPRRHRRLSLQLRVEHSAMAYRAVVRGNRLDLRLSEGFCGAPSHILTSILEASLIPGRHEARERVVDYCRQPLFRDRIAALERRGRRLPDESSQARPRVGQETTSGRNHDLGASFERVNARYFEGRLNRPHLRWSARATRRKMGHYEWEGDVVQLNRSLDDPRVPGFVIDFVMYHELLHKQLGYTMVGGRRRVHTPEFRRREREFEHVQESKDFLDRLEEHLR